MVDFTDDHTAAASHHDSGDISLVLRHILRPSSPLPPPVILPSATVEEYSQISTGPAGFSCSDRISVGRIADDTLNGVVLSSSARFFPGLGQMTGLVGEYTEECDCGNEETNEPVVEETDTKRNNQPRNQSKRSRAAEVHNISEKRRRSKINEKMKALQNLIPNSNKTDKASMLDEAIEYLKQLQLQVQMLSIKNGLNLHAMCLPGAPEIFHSAQQSQIGGDVGHRCGSLDVTMTNAPNGIATPNTSESNAILSLPKQYTSLGAALPGVSTIINSEATSFGAESCVLPNFNSVELHDQAICRNQRVHHNLHYVSNTVTTSQDIGESNFNEYKLLEEEGTQKCGTQIREILPGNISVANQLTSNISGLFAATTSAPNDARKAK